MSQKAGSQGHAARWEEMFKRLVDFKHFHGHCNVPNQYKDDQRLGNWVATQRRQFKTKKYQSKHGRDEKVKRLREIGFDFSPRDTDCVSWESRFNEYVMFKHKDGQTEVPEDKKGLSLWVSTQREEYQLKKQGFSSHLTDHRVELLDKVGFVWEHKPETLNSSRTTNTISNGRLLLDTAASAAPAPRCDEGIVSVLQQCIDTLDAQQKVNEANQAQKQASQRQVEEQLKKGELVSSILNKIFSNNAAVVNVVGRTAYPRLQLAAPPQLITAVGQPHAFDIELKPSVSNFPSQSSNRRKETILELQLGELLSKGQDGAHLSSMSRTESNHVTTTPAGGAINASVLNLPPLNNNTVQNAAASNFSLNQSIIGLSTLSPHKHRIMRTSYAPTQHSLPLKQAYNNYLQTNSSSRATNSATTDSSANHIVSKVDSRTQLKPLLVTSSTAVTRVSKDHHKVNHKKQAHSDDGGRRQSYKRCNNIWY